MSGSFRRPYQRNDDRYTEGPTQRGRCCPAGVPAGHRNYPSGNDVGDVRAGAGSFSLHRSVNGRAGDAEQVGELSGAVLASMKQSHHVCFLPMVQLGLFTTQTPFGFGDFHPLPGAQPNQVRLEISDHREHVEQQPADRTGRS